MKNSKYIMIASLLSVIYTNSFADVTTIKKNLSKSLPDVTVDRIVSTPFKGVYEVDSGRKVFYVDETGSYIIIGNLLDLNTKSSLTEARTEELNIVDWSKLPLGSAIKRTKGAGENNIAIFTDPDCPFCKRLEAETISKLNNVTIYYFLYPLAIHPNAVEHSRQIICSDNQESAMVAFMSRGATISKYSNCTNAKNLEIMQQAGESIVQVNSTPTIILPNGRIVTGLVPADYLSKMIEMNKVK
ncbi:MAG: DsbC family protein [Burkholderiales bacterium]|nr:DsbC family protein [Burkholderiales bacterium]